MAKKNKNPVIRFKGFSDDWDLDRFENLTTINQGLQIAISNRYTKPIEGSYFYITNEFLKEGSKSEYYILTPSESVICTENDVLMTRTGNTGEVVTNVKGAFHNNFFKIKFNPKQINKDFLVYFLKLDSTQLLIRQLAGNSTIPDLNHNDFYRIQISFPKPTEQKKIGTFFQNLDKLITHHQKKYDKLVILKKAMLEKMFPKNGAVVPEIRFKGFSGDWDRELLSKLGDFKSNGVDKKVIPTEIPVNLLNYMDVYNSRYLDANNCKELMQVTAKDNQLKENNVLKNDVFFTPSSETPEDIGKVMVIENDLPNTVYSYHLMRFRPKLNVFYTFFPNYSFASEYIRKQLVFSAQGVQRYTLSKPAFEEITVLIPSLEEQKKIGDYFKNLDTQINSHQTQLDKLKNIKKSCLSKMFVSED